MKNSCITSILKITNQINVFCMNPLKFLASHIILMSLSLVTEAFVFKVGNFNIFAK